MKHFYWIYNGKKYYNKVQALYDSNGDNHAIKFHFMDNVLDKIDTGVEPAQDWNTICQRRAKQIRQNYDYVCLWYSGGWDSTEMLYSFAESNCDVDEIIIFNRTYMEDIEIPEAYKFAKSMVENFWPHCKITLITLDEDWQSQNYISHKQDWIFRNGVSNRFSKNHRDYIVNFHPQILKNREKITGKIADVHGTDKPKLHIYNNHWYCFQVDITMMLLMGTNFELFYFAPTMPDIYLKQCHLSKRYFESLMITDNNLVQEIQNSASNNKGEMYAKWNIAIGRRDAVSNSAFFGLQKPLIKEIGNNLETKDLRKFFKEENQKIYKIWSSSLIDIEKDLKINLFDNSLPISVSKSYILGEVKQNP